MRPVSDHTDESCFVHQYRPRGHYKAHEVNLDADVERGPEKLGQLPLLRYLVLATSDEMCVFKFVFVRCWGYRRESGAQLLEERIDCISI
jgi:hypothetical protein